MLLPQSFWQIGRIVNPDSFPMGHQQGIFTLLTLHVSGQSRLYAESCDCARFRYCNLEWWCSPQIDPLPCPKRISSTFPGHRLDLGCHISAFQRHCCPKSFLICSSWFSYPEKYWSCSNSSQQSHCSCSCHGQQFHVMHSSKKLVLHDPLELKVEQCFDWCWDCENCS